jgi:hypothetical protein
MFTSTKVAPRTESERAVFKMAFFKAILEADMSQERIDSVEAMYDKWTEEKYYRLTTDERREYHAWNDKGEAGCGPVSLWGELNLGLSWQEAKDLYQALYGDRA